MQAEVAKKGLGQRGIIILDALLKLRQVCCDPRLVSVPSAARVKGSAKLELLMTLLPELLEEGRRVLLFSQFTSMLGLIEHALGERGIKPGTGYVKLTGQTKRRDEPVDRFQSGEVPLFLISLKAGGSGLNLTAADTVIHYDRWSNGSLICRRASRPWPTPCLPAVGRPAGSLVRRTSSSCSPPSMTESQAPLGAPGSESDPRALTDRLILEQGQLDPLELLLAADLLAYPDYEAWRLGRRPDLQGALGLAITRAVDLLAQALAYARGQGLEPQPLVHQGWQGERGELTIGADPELQRLCAAVYAPPADRPQLDLFQDSAGLLIESEVRAALGARRPNEAQAAIVRLMQQDPGNRRIAGFLRLVGALEETLAGQGAALGDPGQRLAEIQDLAPLAAQLLGTQARDLLALLWADLAERLADRPFDPRRPRLHASQCWAEAGRWEAARALVESQPGWRDHPALILLHARACWRLGDVTAARQDWVGLCWEHPGAAGRALRDRGLQDGRLAVLWAEFRDLDQDLDTEDFPAWLLIRDPGWASGSLAEDAPRDQRGDAFRVLRRLTQGGDDMDTRRALADAHPVLLTLYLRGRTTPAGAG